MEEQAIKDGFASLKDGSCYDSLYQSALCRAKADWLVGINASRLFSVLYNQNLKVGRVQTPRLAMIVERNQKIKEFTKEKYYMAHIKFDDMDAVTEHSGTNFDRPGFVQMMEDAKNSKKLLEQNELSDKIKFKDFLEIQKFDTEKLREIIKVIRVHSQDEIEIEWNFDDIFSEQR